MADLSQQEEALASGEKECQGQTSENNNIFICWAEEYEKAKMTGREDVERTVLYAESFWREFQQCDMPLVG